MGFTRLGIQNKEKILTKNDVIAKLNECKRLFSLYSDTLLCVYNSDFYIRISDMFEEMEEYIEEHYDYDDISKRLDSFLDALNNVEFFYKEGKYNKKNTPEDIFKIKTKPASKKKQMLARSNMNVKSLSILDEYIDSINEYIQYSVSCYSLSDVLLTVHKNIDFEKASVFCDSDDAGAIITIRIKSTTRPKNNSKKENTDEQ